jgi:hypothetical protein
MREALEASTLHCNEEAVMAGLVPAMHVFMVSSTTSKKLLEE